MGRREDVGGFREQQRLTLLVRDTAAVAACGRVTPAVWSGRWPGWVQVITRRGREVHLRHVYERRRVYAAVRDDECACVVARGDMTVTGARFKGHLSRGTA